MGLQSVKDCKAGNCEFHFPQFRDFELEELLEALSDALSEGNDSYYHKNYSNWLELNNFYEEIRKELIEHPESFVDICGKLMDYIEEIKKQDKHSYVTFDLFLKLGGREVCQFIPCCK